MPVAHQLTRLWARVRQTQAEHHVIQPALQGQQQGHAGHALHVLRVAEVAAELAFLDAVNAARLLLFAQLRREIRFLVLEGTLLAVHARRIIALFEGALGRIAALALQKEFHAFPAAEPAHRINPSCQWILLYSLAIAREVYGLATFIPLRTGIGY